jgi:hypothetical protein
MSIYISTPPYTFMAQCLIKHRDNLPFFLFFYPEYTRAINTIKWVKPNLKGNVMTAPLPPVLLTAQDQNIES